MVHRPAWLDEPALQAHATVDELIATIRNCRDGCGRSDAIVRCLARVGEKEPDAWTVLVYALVAMTWPRMGREVSDSHQREVVGEVTIVLLEALTRGDLDRLDALAWRLVKRTHSRLRRDTLSDTTRGKQRQFTVEATPPDRLARVAHAGSFVDDAVGDAAVASLELSRVVATINSAIESGDLPAKAWADFRRLYLSRVLYSDLSPTTGQERSALWRARKAVCPRLARSIGGSAA